MTPLSTDNTAYLAGIPADIASAIAITFYNFSKSSEEFDDIDSSHDALVLVEEQDDTNRWSELEPVSILDFIFVCCLLLGKKTRSMLPRFSDSSKFLSIRFRLPFLLLLPKDENVIGIVLVTEWFSEKRRLPALPFWWKLSKKAIITMIMIITTAAK